VEDNAKIIMASSHDDGKTWAHQYPAGERSGIRGPNMIYDAVADNLVLQYQTVDGSKLYQTTSSTNGHQWTDPVEIKLKECSHTGETAGQRVQTSTGRLLFYGGGADSGKYPSCLWWSDDHGKTYNSSSDPILSNEVSFARTAGKQIYANGRGVVGKWQPYRIDYRSEDDGITWTRAKSTLQDPEKGQECERSLVYGNGLLYTAEPKGNKDTARADLSVSCSTNGGKTWHNATVVGGDNVAGYSSLGVRKDGKLLVVWDFDKNYEHTNDRGDSKPGAVNFQIVDPPMCS